MLPPLTRRRSTRDLVRRFLIGSVALLSVVAVVLAVWLWRTWESVPRFEDLSAEWDDVVPARPSNDGSSTDGGLLPLRSRAPTVREEPRAPSASSSGEEVLPPTTTTIVLPDVPGRDQVENFLVFSTGTTEITDEEALAIGVSDPDQRGSDDLTDVIMVLTVGRSTGSMAVTSIPRDTWLDHRRSRINTVFRQFGPGALASDVAELTGLDIDHLIRVNMMGFVQLTDILGGVNITVDQPIRDLWTGLDLPAGQAQLDGSSALRYVRSRRAEVYVDEEWVPDRSADFGRMQRQRKFLVAVMSAAWSLDAVANLPGILDAVQRNVVLDEELGLRDLIDLSGKIRNGGGSLPGHQLPAEVGWVGPASVVFVDRVGARELSSDVVASVIS